MSTDAVSTRRSLLKGGALLAAPLAAATGTAAMAAEAHKTRLAQLEDEAAIRDLHRTWLRRTNTGAREDAAHLFADPKRAEFHEAIRSISADHAGAPDAITIATDGERAAGQFQCVVEIETAMVPDCTLVQMAHAQGGGFIRRTERRVLKVEYVKADRAWVISKLEFASA